MSTDTCTATQTVPNTVRQAQTGGPDSQESQKHKEFNFTNQKKAT